MKNIFILFCVLWGHFVYAQANLFSFSSIDNNQGLSHGQVNSIFKDRKGFMWFGTMAGLNRYDGYNFKVFYHDSKDSSSLKDSYVTQIFQGPDNLMWVVTLQGISLYDPLNEKFHSLTKAYLKQYFLPDDKIKSIFQDRHKNFWFIHEHEGLIRCDSLGNNVIKIANDHANNQSVISNKISSIAQSPDGNYWLIHTNGMLECMDKEGKNIIKRDPAFYKKHENKDYQLYIDSEGDFWIYVKNELKGVFYLNHTFEKNKHFHTDNSLYKLNANLIYGITQDKQGLIWIATDHGGVNIIDKKNFSITYLLNQTDDKKSLSHNSVYSLYKDDDGIIWLGTYKNGVNYYHENIYRFHLYDRKNSLAPKLFKDVNHFVEDKKGNLWIGTNEDGLFYFDRKNSDFKQFKHDPKDPQSISSNVIISLYIDGDQKLWVGTYYGGLNVYDGKNFFKYQHDDEDINSISDDRIWSINEDSKKNLWIGTLGGGLNRLDRQTNKFYKYKQGEEKSIHDDYIASIIEDSDGNLFVATSYGLDVMEKGDDFFKHYNSRNSDLSNDNVFNIIEDSRGFIWLATRDGLNLFDKETKTFRVFTEKDGLPHNMILSVIEDDYHNLWLSTSKGLSNLVPTYNEALGTYEFYFKNYDQVDGLQARNFNIRAAYKTKAGELVFGGANGFNLFHPDDIKLNTILPQVVLTDFQIFNKSLKVGEELNGRPILNKSISEVKEVVLKYDENVIKIEFAALSYFHPEKNKYAYKLDGFDKEWLKTEENFRYATYTNLDPGQYLFKVKASNNDGEWCDQGAELKLIVLPPFWKTNIAYTGYIIIILGLLMLARYLIQRKERVRFRLEQERQEILRLHQLDQMKMKFFTNISHEFRTPLTLIMTPLEEIILNTKEGTKKEQFLMIHRNARRLLNLVNQLLDFRKIEVQGIKLNLSEGDIVQFIKETSYSFSDLTEKKNIDFSFHSNVIGLEAHFDQDKLEKIIFNLLSNAIKFTPEFGSVEIFVNIKEIALETGKEWLEVKVKDTGIGIPKENHDAIFERFVQSDTPGPFVNQGSGIGLSLAKEFVKLHGGTISLESEIGQGACFTVLLPLKKVGQSAVVIEEYHEYILKRKQLRDSIKNKTSLKIEKKRTVLLVEDNEDILFYLKESLKDKYDILEAFNGKEGLQKATDLVPDIIVSDIMMPEMDGLEMCKRVKSNKKTAHVPVILLTARTAEEQKLLGFETGASDYITKPFNFKVLASRINNLLVNSENYKDLFKQKIDVNPSRIDIVSLDDQFLNKTIKLVENNISNAEFSVTELSFELGMSRSQLYKKVYALTGKTPVEFIRILRLKRAKQLLEESQLTIAEIAYEVGFNDPKYFTKIFKSEFNILPSLYDSKSI